MDQKIIYKELSYEIIGILFNVFEELGYDYHEKYYERAIAKCLISKGIPFKRQFPAQILFNKEKIGQVFFDFLIDDKIVLEIKVGNRFLRNNFAQVKNYLKASGKQLGILANFTSNGVKFYRILNIHGNIQGEVKTYKLTNYKKFTI